MAGWKLRAAPRIALSGSVAASGEIAADAGLPAWRTGLAAWEWYRLTGASLSNTLPDVLPAIGTAKNRIESWNGFVVIDTRAARAGVGGHGDWAGNEGYENDYGVETPGAPTILSQPTPDEDVIENANYYADGRPTATHTYYGLHADPDRNQIVRLGVAAATGNGNFHSAKCDAYDLTAGDWLAAGTIPDVPEYPDYSLAQCQHPVTRNVYVIGETKLWRYNMAARTWTDLGVVSAGGGQGSAFAGRASLIDVTRNRLVILGNSYSTPAGIQIFDLEEETWSSGTLTGDLAALAAAQSGNAAFHLAGPDIYVMRRSWSAATGGVDNGPIQMGGGEMLQIDPETFEVSDLPTTGGSGIPATWRGVWGLLQPMPALGGFIFEPRGDSAVSGCDPWFLASE